MSMSKCGALDMADSLTNRSSNCAASYTQCHALRKRGIQYAETSRTNRRSLEYWVARSRLRQGFAGPRTHSAAEALAKAASRAMTPLKLSYRPISPIHHHDRSRHISRKIGRKEDRRA